MSQRIGLKGLIRYAVAIILSMGLSLICIWLEHTVLWIIAVLFGIVVGAGVWIFSDFQTGFFSGFLAWIGFSFLTPLIIGAMEFAVEALIMPRKKRSDCPEPASVP